MPHKPDPLRSIAEILGEPASSMSNPANAEYRCRFIDGVCQKSSHSMTGPYPVCSIHRRERRDRSPICVCPVRFLEADIVSDVINNCWIGNKPDNPVRVHEVKMDKFGKVDMVVADVTPDQKSVNSFVSVELQAVDITGSVLPAYEAIVHRTPLERQPSHGFNWANVRKRFVSQLVAKGFYHHHWNSRIVAVLQKDMFDELQKHAHVPEVSLQDSNIVFMLYQLVWEEDRWVMTLDRVVPTTHVNVMNAVIYERPPSKEEFMKKIIERLRYSHR